MLINLIAQSTGQKYATVEADMERDKRLSPEEALKY